MDKAPSDTLQRLDKLTARQILAIPSQEPEWLYSGDAEALRHEYRRLAKLWYPDINKDPLAEAVFKHIDLLRHVANERIGSGTWHKPGELTLTPVSGLAKTFNYAKKHDFALGAFYISESAVAYVVKPEHKALYDNAVKTIRNFPFADSKMREQCERFLPHIADAFVAKEGCVLILDKAPELVSLRDALDRSGGKLDPKHAAWMLSSLHNASCYLEWAKITHNDISLDTVFVAPKSHYAAVLGGWWYAAEQGRPLAYLPDRTYDHAPPDVMRRGNADTRVDLGLIRLTGRELLGDPSGLHLSHDKVVPASMAAWLQMPTSGKAKNDYATWVNTILPESFSARRYVEMNLNFSDVYRKGERPWASPHP